MERMGEKPARQVFEGKYHAIFSEASDGIVLIDGKTGQIVDCNPEFERQTGRQLEQLRAMKIWEVRPFEKVASSKKKFFEIQKKGVGGSEELEFQKPDGEIVSVEFLSRLITIHGQQFIQSIVRDITKRKRTEEALRISEEKFRRLSSVAFEGIAIHEKGKILDANQTLADMFGYELSEFIGKNALDFTAPESRELLLKHILSGYEKPYEAIGVRKDKSTFPVEIIGKSAAYQGRQVRVAALRDITERKRMEEALTEQMRRNEQILQTTMDGFILADTAGQVIDVNPAYCEMVGYSRAELLRMNIRELEGKFVPGEIEQRIKHMLKQGKDQFETKHRCKDGKIIDLEVSIVIMQSEQRPLVAAFVRDITERKRADKELRKSRERLLKAQKVARMGFLDWDLKTNKIYLSDEIYRLLGLKSQRVLTTPELIEQVVHPDDLDYVRKNLELARRGEIKYNIDHRVVQPNGNIL
ncbi:MAG: PAS domain S-box protein, partial [bacterium]